MINQPGKAIQGVSDLNLTVEYGIFTLLHDAGIPDKQLWTANGTVVGSGSLLR